MPTREGPDYYRILGVGRGASLDEIKRAYHRLATRVHPDAHPDDPDAEACLRSLNQAYALLKDPARRAHYDRWGASGPPAWRSSGATTPRSWMATVVDHLLAVQRQLDLHKPRRGQDMRYTLAIDPQACVSGCQARLSIPHRRWCPQCLGSRVTGGKLPDPCEACQGAGEVRRPGRFLSSIHRCDQCHGNGVVVTQPCWRCDGQGSIRVTRTLTIDIPAGMRDGGRIRIQGEGGAGYWGGAPGDLYVDIRLMS
jgi:molecular chaperone DnaJ